MSRDHFKKVMYSPYFQSDGYAQSEAGKKEQKIISFFNLKRFFNRNKKEKF